MAKRDDSKELIINYLCDLNPKVLGSFHVSVQFIEPLRSCQNGVKAMILLPNTKDRIKQANKPATNCIRDDKRCANLHPINTYVVLTDAISKPAAAHKSGNCWIQYATKRERWDEQHRNTVKRCFVLFLQQRNTLVLWITLSLQELVTIRKCFKSDTFAQEDDKTYMSKCYSALKDRRKQRRKHYSDVIMGAMASQITSLSIVFSSFSSGTDQRQHQSS